MESLNKLSIDATSRENDNQNVKIQEYNEHSTKMHILQHRFNRFKQKYVKHTSAFKSMFGK